ncbi:MAG: domain 2 [Verrucomicrobiales bacterium]|nr:domain 2 [Verrucomicrobiales bacterium]
MSGVEASKYRVDSQNMALINCVECGKQVSDKAQTCVGCGAPVSLSSSLHSPAPPKGDRTNDTSGQEQFYVLLGDTECGPYTISQLKQVWLNGEINTETLYAKPGMNEWKPLAEIFNRIRDFEAHKEQSSGSNAWNQRPSSIPKAPA